MTHLYGLQPIDPARILWHWLLHFTLWLMADARLWGPAFVAPSDDLDYDYGSESAPFGAFSGPEVSTEDVRFPSNTNAPPATKYTPGNGSMPRPCEQLVHLYNLQPDRLNTSGLFNPLKGKLTNCHSSGCERYRHIIFFIGIKLGKYCGILL